MDIALIPQSAPFSPEQRAWLNGFLAGWLGLNPPAPPPAVNGHAPGASPATVEKSTPAAEPEPWHDPSIALDERLKLAEGQPRARRLMAAMAQLDCGACGYVCRTYAEAIDSGAESRLSLCAPGGSETARALKRLVKDAAQVNGNGSAKNGVHLHVNGVVKNGSAKPGVNGWSRENPFTARVVRTSKLNGAGSEKETRHVEIELGGAGPRYEVGDSLGVYPENCGALADAILSAVGASGDEPVRAATGEAATLRAALVEHSCLNEVTERLLALLGATADPGEAAALLGLLDDDGPLAGFDVLDVLNRFPSARPSPDGFAAALAPVRPRLYSISSSPRRHAGQVHLTVRRVSYAFNGRERKGVASTMLADRVVPGSPLRVFVQKSHGFGLPADPSAPIIMIGPGTGIAPFRAFLHEREAAGASGRSWLFFGDQRRAHDFLYEAELTDFLRRGVLTRLDTAFSRDQGEKVYVQHRIIEHGAELFRWLESGAFVYVCGDARRMAADVDRALRQVVRTFGRRDEAAAGAYVAQLAAEGRYRRDVY
jgi:sulfite reductase (NADPH) flavoprotein alpha-component